VKRLFFIAFFLSVHLISVAKATFFQPMPLEQLVGESNAAAEVILKEKKSFMNKIGIIQTEFKFILSDSFNLSDSDLDGEFLTITMTGGSYGGVTSFIDGAPTFEIGEKSFLLLKKLESKIYLSNFTLGKYKVISEGGESWYVSSVFPYDQEIGKIKKEKMLEVVKQKFKITQTETESLPKDSFKEKFENVTIEKRMPAQIDDAEPASKDGVWAMWAYLVVFLSSGATIWWKLRRGM
jgi:hypothetical protein